MSQYFNFDEESKDQTFQVPAFLEPSVFTRNQFDLHRKQFSLSKSQIQKHYILRGSEKDNQEEINDKNDKLLKKKQKSNLASLDLNDQNQNWLKQKKDLLSQRGEQNSLFNSEKNFLKKNNSVESLSLEYLRFARDPNANQRHIQDQIDQKIKIDGLLNLENFKNKLQIHQSQYSNEFNRNNTSLNSNFQLGSQLQPITSKYKDFHTESQLKSNSINQHKLNDYLTHLNYGFDNQGAKARMANIFDRNNQNQIKNDKNSKIDEMTLQLKNNFNKKIAEIEVENNSRVETPLIQKKRQVVAKGNKESLNFIVLDEFIYEFAQNLLAVVKRLTKKQIKNVLSHIQGYDKLIEQFLFKIKEDIINGFNTYDLKSDILSPETLKQAIYQFSEEIQQQQGQIQAGGSFNSPIKIYNSQKKKNQNKMQIQEQSNKNLYKNTSQTNSLQFQLSLKNTNNHAFKNQNVLPKLDETQSSIQKSNKNFQSNKNSINKTQKLESLQKMTNSNFNNNIQNDNNDELNNRYIDKELVQKLHYYNRYLHEHLENKAEENIKIKQQDFAYYNKKLNDDSENYILKQYFHKKDNVNLINEIVNKKDFLKQGNSEFILRGIQEIESKYGKLHMIASKSRFDCLQVNKIQGSQAYQQK